MNEQQYPETSYDEESYNEQKRQEKRARRIQEMKKQKERQILLQNCVKIAVPVVAVVLVISLIVANKGSDSENDSLALNASETIEVSSEAWQEETTESAGLQSTSEVPIESTEPQVTQNAKTAENEVAQQESAVENHESIIYSASTTADTLTLSDQVVSSHALFIDLDNDTILAQKSAKTIISPASMTKVLTVLVAAEHMEASQMDDTFTMTLDITDYSYVNDCSNVGFLDGEVITVRDLFYGTILQSGGDAAVGLATYIAGSHEAFVEMMNEKLEELGLSDTAHVTNCVGLYDEDHYCTAYDMAMIMEAAIANDICREVMSARTYTTSFTEQHPEGISISNWFIRRIEDKDTGGKVVCAKTGYVVQSGSCAVSYGNDLAGKEYICVTADSTSSWRCIYDHVALYKMFATGEQ